ncbi:hypothetical protein Ndes2437A_g06722 [Nannochloris sp. 'desiccata']
MQLGEKPGLVVTAFGKTTARPCKSSWHTASTSRRENRTAVHSTKRIVCDTASAATKKRQSLKKDKPPPLPTPQSHQQTVQRSFTLGGVGLHTGEYSFVCVRPALAGEGRYFVRVSPGTNAPDFRPETPQLIHHSELDIERGAEDGVSDDDRGQLYLQYLEAVDNKRFSGNFGDYIKDRYGDPTDSFWMDLMAQGPPEDATARVEEGITASVDYAESYLGAATMLSNETYMVLSPEALLSALEACGVDNARIEIEGGGDIDADGDVIGNVSPLLEVPVVDGSALGWVLEIQKAGLRDAMPSSGGSSSNDTARMANAPQEMITVTKGDSFISFYPGLTPKITAGVDFSGEADIVGKQWFTWSPAETSSIDNFDKHYRWEIAPARTVLPSISAAEDMYASGLLRAGPDDCCLVGNGDSWYDPALERFPQEEAARKAVADLVGNLALSAKSGWRGMPQGHVVAYKASTDLQLQFAKAMNAKAGEWAYANADC